MNVKQLKNHDWMITIIVGLLIIIGVITIFSTTYNAQNEAEGLGSLPKQLIFIIIGLAAYFVLSAIESSWLQTKSILILLYVAIILALIYVRFFGQTIAGTNRWIDIGFFSFQPSEYAKIVLIMITAAIFTANDKIIHTLGVAFNSKRSKAKSQESFNSQLHNLLEDFPVLKRYLLSLVLSVPIIILTLIQPSLGNAVILSFILLTMLFTLFPHQLRLTVFIGLVVLFMTIIAQFVSVAKTDYAFEVSGVQLGANLFWAFFLIILIALSVILTKTRIIYIGLALVVSIGLFAGTIYSWNKLLTNYQKDRINTFLQGPESDPLGTGYQVRQSEVAIGSGRLLGRGFLQGTQSSQNILTQSYTDFAFAALSEQFGFVGSSLVLILYALLIIRILRVGLASASSFGTVICLGVAALILLHVFINIGMNLGKLPVTGIPLPLISYGGSSIFVTMLSLGLVQSVAGSKRAVDISDKLMLRSRSRIMNK